MAPQQKDLILGALRIVDKYFVADSEQPKTFGCHHIAETCMACACEGLVRRWKEQKQIRAAIKELEAMPTTEPK